MLASGAGAQMLKTAYFMEGSTHRSALNPALQPNRGYINLPVVGFTGVSYSSNSLSLDKVFFPSSDGNGLVTYLDESVDAGQFLSGLKENNKLNAHLALNIIGFGFYAGKGFWTFDINLKTNSNSLLPKGLFEFTKIGSGTEGKEYNLKNMQVNIDSYVDIGLGYSRPINDKLTVGGRVKFIGGVANISMKYDNMHIKMTDEQWLINAKGRLNVTAAGLKFKSKIDEDTGKEIIDFDSFDIKPNGMAGYGGGVDLGASYKLFDKLTLSMAVIDLGAIRWSGKNTAHGVATGQYNFSGFDIVDGQDQGASDFGDFEEFTEFETSASKSYTRWLNTTLNVGAEYEFCKKKLAVGLLSSTQFRSSGTYTEITAAGVVRPCRWFSASLSYSMLHGYNSFGAALNFHPAWINFFVGTDYVMLKVTPQGVPYNLNAANIYLGLAIPVGKKPEWRKK